METAVSNKLWCSEYLSAVSAPQKVLLADVSTRNWFRCFLDISQTRKNMSDNIFDSKQQYFVSGLQLLLLLLYYYSHVLHCLYRHLFTTLCFAAQFIHSKPVVGNTPNLHFPFWKILKFCSKFASQSKETWLLFENEENVKKTNQ